MRLDILIYAHDGRGLGHVSRSLGIGMALRRLYPKLRILFISGSGFTGELLGKAPLDWLKLPAYKTEVVGGVSKGIPGDSMFSDEELGELRSRDLSHVVQQYKPRLVLVDHTPQGKHRELLHALEVAPEDCRWVLGVRGVVGAVKQAKSDVTRTIFQKYYSDLLWYGDSGVLGKDHCRLLKEQYEVVPFECGYVSRLGEYLKCNGLEEKRPWAGVVSVPWLGEKTLLFLECLAGALRTVPADLGSWRLFVDAGDGAMKTTVDNLFSGLINCSLKRPGGNYAGELMNAKSAIIYGGYNSLVDIIFADIPSLVILRQMKDQEQQDHVACLEKKLGGTLMSLCEDEVTVEKLRSGLLYNATHARSQKYGVEVDGALHAARHLYSML
ncbi:MAG: putative glycosyltransferase [Desulforhopalus sp.]